MNTGGLVSFLRTDGILHATPQNTMTCWKYEQQIANRDCLSLARIQIMYQVKNQALLSKPRAIFLFILGNSSQDWFWNLTWCDRHYYRCQRSIFMLSMRVGVGAGGVGLVYSSALHLSRNVLTLFE